MKKPIDNVESKLNEAGVFTQPKKSFADDNEGHLLGITIEVGYPLGTEIEAPDFNILTANRRGVRSFFSDFKVEDKYGQRILSFIAYQRIPDAISLPAGTSHLIATSFIDLCWYSGNEAVDATMTPTCGTEKNPKSVTSDLGWYLPSRFVDTMIDALGRISTVFLDGAIEEAILYGVLYKEGKTS